MDLTPIFKASVKTVRLRKKSLPTLDKNRILAKPQRSEFAIKTKDICYQITQLKNLLLENRSAYMRFGYHLKSAVQMTDQERDIIDQESEKILSICTKFIGDLRKECSKLNCSQQARQHMEGVLELLTSYQRSVYNIYEIQRAYRMKHELDTYKLLKLESNKKLIPVIPAKERIKIDEGCAHLDSSSDIVDNDSDDVENEIREMRSPAKNLVAVDEDIALKFAMEEDLISAEDIQMFESENHQMYNELKGLSDEVELIEKNVVDIAKLQEIFSEKV